MRQAASYMTSTLPRAVQDLTQELTRLPGIGPKTAQRLSIHLLRQPAAVVGKLSNVLQSLHEKVHICSRCFNLAEKEVCRICTDPTRDGRVVCVVEDPLDIEAIERSGSYNGLYHVLGGLLSPIDGIGEEQLTMKELRERLAHTPPRELIIALDQNMEAEATARHITQRIPAQNIKITRLARGLPTGGDIEFADALTLSAAFVGRKTLQPVE